MNVVNKGRKGGEEMEREGKLIGGNGNLKERKLVEWEEGGWKRTEGRRAKKTEAKRR